MGDKHVEYSNGFYTSLLIPFSSPKKDKQVNIVISKRSNGPIIEVKF